MNNVSNTFCRYHIVLSEHVYIVPYSVPVHTEQTLRCFPIYLMYCRQTGCMVKHTPDPTGELKQESSITPFQHPPLLYPWLGPCRCP